MRAAANEIGRLVNGGGDITNGSQTIYFIPHCDKPHNQQATYLHIVTKDKPYKKEKKRIRFTIGGDRIEYKGKLATTTSNLTTIKIHLNSVVSTPGAKYDTADISNFYLGTPLDTFEYMRINIRDIPDKIITKNTI